LLKKQKLQTCLHHWKMAWWNANQLL
jgi:hypothetical protein